VVTGFVLLTRGLLIMWIRPRMAMKLSCEQLTVLVTLNGVTNHSKVWLQNLVKIWSKSGQNLVKIWFDLVPSCMP
jgi:hypothetical protein